MPKLSGMQQWGMFIGKTLEEIPDLNERLNLQAYITTLIADFFNINNFIDYYILQNYDDQ